MRPSRPSARRRARSFLAPAAIAVGAGLLTTTLPYAAAAPGDPGVPVPDNLNPRITDAFTSEVNGLADLDKRVAAVAPSLVQKQAAQRLDADVRWGRYGTPSSISPTGADNLGDRKGSAVRTAKSWMLSNRALLGLTEAQVEGLDLVGDQLMQSSDGHAVLFRQSFGGLVSAVDGMITVGVGRDGVEYVSSSLTKATARPVGATLTPQQAWLSAAKDVGITKAVSDLTGFAKDTDTGFTTFKAAGFPQEQQVRLRALAVSNGSVRPVYETNVVNSQGGLAVAYTSFVDAATGQVLVRHNQVDNLASGGRSAIGVQAEPQVGQFEGEFSATACGPDEPIPVGPGQRTIAVVATAANAVNDIVLVLKDPSGKTVASGDTGTSPESVTYSPGGELPPGEYKAAVCPFAGAVILPPFNYVGTYVVTDQELDTPERSQPAFVGYLSNPKLNFSPDAGGGARATMCWVRQVEYPGVTCTPDEFLNNLASRLPWDVDPRSYLSTNTTAGNNAVTAEAWTSPLTPGALGQRPIQPDRTYDDEFSDDWNNSRCSQTELVPGGNDILAATTDLFAGHNRYHDYSYFLGFTENNFNMQQTNFGQRGADGDPEIGNVQAGAVTGGAPSYLGRDNANQITLQDGVPGITNQYLFQPIAAAFYAPCVDGDLDASIWGHEYTHAITSRMVGGPDGGINGFQGGSMGESWSDQVATEYLFAHDYDQGTTTPWVVGAYATGNKTLGIRNYALDKNPLQYGDLGYDSTGPEVHADGEVWSAGMWNVREELVRKWDARGFEYTDEKLQRKCSQGFRGTQSPMGPLVASRCPGNTRWITLMFDSFLLQQSATSMLDARDAMLAADRMRFFGNNQQAIWNGFARTGMGRSAVTNGTDDDEPKPGYDSPKEPEGIFKLKAVDGRRTVNGELFVSKYEARVSPVADTDSKTKRGSSIDMVPGRYPFVFRAKGYGITTFNATVKAGQTTVKTLKLERNLASFFSGARIDGVTGEGDEEAVRNPSFLIDDTQASNLGVQTDGNVDKTQPVVNVDLAGATHTVKSVRVSAQLRPVQAADSGPQGPEEVTDDPDSGSRFTALRQFAIEVCNQSAAQDCSGTDDAGYRRIFTSAPNAFDSDLPRPGVPTTLLKTFNVPDTKATHVRLVVLNNQCTGFAGYHGEQDADPTNDTDCRNALLPEPSNRGTIAHVAELQVFE